MRYSGQRCEPVNEVFVTGGISEAVTLKWTERAVTLTYETSRNYRPRSLALYAEGPRPQIFTEGRQRSVIVRRRAGISVDRCGRGGLVRCRWSTNGTAAVVE